MFLVSLYVLNKEMLKDHADKTESLIFIVKTEVTDDSKRTLVISPVLNVLQSKHSLRKCGLENIV